MVSLSVLGNTIIVVNSMRIVMDLLERRSSTYSDRPRMVMLNELVGFGWGLAFRPYDNAWRDGRKMFHQEFHPTAVKRFRPVELEYVHQFLQSLLSTPHDVLEHLRHLAGGMIMKIAYGIGVKPLGDPFVKIAEEAVQSVAATTNAGSYLVDILPILQYLPDWFPGAEFKKDAARWRVWVHDLLHKPFDAVAERVSRGDSLECVATSLIETFSKNAEDKAYTEKIIRETLGSMYIGGADTTVSALGSFFLAMVLHPEIQVSAQKELDRVVGTDRLPDFSDYDSLPYVTAIVRESLRWNPVVPLDVPHRSTSDDVYAGYFIPKGTLVVANSWAILHDEELYGPDPSTYNPDRFMKDGRLNPDVRDPATAAFGFGRRICPGRFMAQESMWITIANVLATFTIKKAIGLDDKPITPPVDYYRGFLCYPKPFPCSIEVRSKEHQSLIRDTQAR
ncbi:cytochrome P450 [Obba rivulosa]|uniref:Cytochrome P450 n=1 Tax=Obba rivulosa TaxID=1052685 RepID=A0A8E2J760_9APHY|nr:cytochrome P450 [Obba rivulosa]